MKCSNNFNNLKNGRWWNTVVEHSRGTTLIFIPCNITYPFRYEDQAGFKLRGVYDPNATSRKPGKHGH